MKSKVTSKNERKPSDYAWKTDNIDDLFEDILEAMEIGGNHYLGTFILSSVDKTKDRKVDRFKVVDGQ
jgi:uncharacterized protein with ParB-like and HNH nuclease domain